MSSAGTQGWLITRLYFFERILLYVSFVAIILFIIFHSIAMLVIGLILGSVPLVRQLRDKKLASA